MLDYFRNCSIIAHQVCCQDSPTKGPFCHLCQSDDLDILSRSQLRLKLNHILTWCLALCSLLILPLTNIMVELPTVSKSDASLAFVSRPVVVLHKLKGFSTSGKRGTIGIN